MARIFLSTENTSEPHVVVLRERLSDEGHVITTSPLNPSIGPDPRWSGWYAHGCQDSLASSDVFLAVESRGYRASTWMAIEFDLAWKLWREKRRPRLFWLQGSTEPLPAGLRQYVEDSTPLPLDVGEAVRAVLAAVRDD